MTNRFCALAGVDIPVIGAPMTFIAGAQLAAAVSNAGGLGIIETTSEQGRADLRRVRDLTDRPVGANISLFVDRDPAFVDELVDLGIRFVTTSAGDPRLFTTRLRDAGITVFHVVGTLAAARKAADAGVDGLVVEGVEGGGFKNRFGASSMVLLPLVADHVDLPLIAAGGICDARTMAAVFTLVAECATRPTTLFSSSIAPLKSVRSVSYFSAKVTLMRWVRLPSAMALRPPASSATTMRWAASSACRSLAATRKTSMERAMSPISSARSRPSMTMS